MKPLSSKALDLFYKTMDCSQVHTDQGDKKTWAELENFGVVRKCTSLGFGHRFDYAITALGVALRKEREVQP